MTDPFFGKSFMALSLLDDGTIFPPPAVKVADVLLVKHAFHLGPGIYSVVNLTKQYQCFVQFQRGEQGQYLGRCEHDNCHWQQIQKDPKPCKHLRRACPWHVKLMRRAGIRSTMMAQITPTVEPRGSSILVASPPEPDYITHPGPVTAGGGAKYVEGMGCPHDDNCQGWPLDDLPPFPCAGHLIRQEHDEEWRPKEGQQYFYAWWFRCNKCLHTFMPDEAKRPTEDWAFIGG